MDKICLISYSFVPGGGVRNYGYQLNQALKSYSDLPIYTASIDEFMPRLHFPILNIAIKRFLYFNLNKVKSKNAHAISIDTIPGSKLKNFAHKIVTMHDLFWLDKEYFKNSSKLLAALERNYYKNIKLYDFVIANNEKVKQIVIDKYSIPENKITIIPSFVPDNFKPLEKYKNNKTVIGYINSFAPNKIQKLRTFIEKFKDLKDDSIEFKIYGRNFPFVDLIRKDPRIKYFGFLPDEKLVETYNSFDVFLSTSEMEGFGLPIAQAKACKVPVLCYDGDIPSITKNNTILWNDDNIEELITKRAWKNVNIEKAYADIMPARPKNVAISIIDVYKKIFE